MTQIGKLDWAFEQMEAVGATDGQKHLAQQLLELYWNNEDPKVLKMFSELAQGNPLVNEEQDDEWRWLPAKPGNIFVRDTVRVMSNAYSDSDARSVHNGRVGYVVSTRYGIIKVHYTDGNDEPGSFTQHRLGLLEKRYL